MKSVVSTANIVKDDGIDGWVCRVKDIGYEDCGIPYSELQVYQGYENIS